MILDDPILVLSSKGQGRSGTNSRILLFGNVVGKNGKPVMTVLDLHPMEGVLIINDMQKIVSAYTKTANPAEFVAGSKALYLDKKRANRLLSSIGLHKRPTSRLPIGYIGSITYSDGEINISGEPLKKILRMKLRRIKM